MARRAAAWRTAGQQLNRLASPLAPTSVTPAPLRRRRLSSFASTLGGAAGASRLRDAFVDKALRSRLGGDGQGESAWVDSPTVVVADPLHPGGFDFHVDLERPPSTTSGVAAFVREREAGKVPPDPFALVQDEITTLSSGIRQLLGSDHPVLELCARHFFDWGDGGKKIRPTMVLLLALATNPPSHEGLLASQRRLAEITEMIHTASLFHDDVIDKADTRRGVESVNKAYGNKLAILAGDFLLARASVALARLRNVEVVELISSIIEHLVKGEVMQMRGGHLQDVSALEYYFHKNYYKTGSLMANSCKAAVVLGGGSAVDQDIAFAYGKHIGLAFQLVDDVLDFEGTVESLGKPALADLRAGLVTAPVLLAVEKHPELQPLIDRKFSEPGDVEKALAWVEASDGLERTKDLAVAQADLAMDSIMQLPPSEAREALAHLAFKVVARSR